MIRADSMTAFLIDFGLAQQFHNPATYLHVLYSTNHPIVGTLPFMSINGQQGHAQSHRDNLESLAYTIIFSARSSLPWINLSDREAILQKKLSVAEEELCAGLPTPFLEFIGHVRALSFNQKPNY